MSEVLKGSKRYYSEMEKIYYDMVMSDRKLHHYFETHTILVLMNQPSMTSLATEIHRAIANGQWSCQNMW
jgi:hypothetical protein